MPVIMAEETRTPTTTTTTTTTATTDGKWKFYILANVLGYILNAAIVFGFGSLGWANRPTNGELSDKYQTIITPSGWAFSIWGPIFILQLVWVIWQLLPKQRTSQGIYATAFWYLGVCLAQVGWTLAFSYEVMWLSLVFMYSILACLIAIHVRVQRYEKVWKGYFLWQFPFSLHLGWISAASLVNTSLVLVAYDVSATSQFRVAIASLVVVVLVALAFLRKYPVDFTPPLVLVWALGAIYTELEDPLMSITMTFTEGQIDGIQTGVLAVMSSIAGLVLVKLAYVFAVQRPRSILERNSNNASSRPSAAVTESSSPDVEAGHAKTGLEHGSDKDTSEEEP